LPSQNLCDGDERKGEGNEEGGEEKEGTRQFGEASRARVREKDLFEGRGRGTGLIWKEFEKEVGREGKGRKDRARGWGMGEREEGGKERRHETYVGISAPAKNFLSTPPGVITAIRMTPPEEPSLAIARERAGESENETEKRKVSFGRSFVQLDSRRGPSRLLCLRD